MSPMVRRSLSIEYALLGFLRQGPTHAYQLHQQFCDPAGLKQIWYLKQAQLYALLSKFEKAGFISASIQQQETRPARRVFQLTRSGQKVFQDWITSPVLKPRQMRQEFQAKLYFARIEGSAVCESLISLQRQVCRQWLTLQSKSTEQDSLENVFSELVDRYRSGQIQAMLDWLDICQEKLQDIPLVPANN